MRFILDESHQKGSDYVSLAYLFSITAAYAQTVQDFTLQNLVWWRGGGGRGQGSKERIEVGGGGGERMGRKVM